MIDCYEVSDKGIQRVSVPDRTYVYGFATFHGDKFLPRYWRDIRAARQAFALRRGWPQNPRVAPRTGVGVVVTPRAAEPVPMVPRIGVPAWMFPPMYDIDKTPYGIDKPLYANTPLLAHKNGRGAA